MIDYRKYCRKIRNSDARRNEDMCDECAFYIYDEDLEEYVCDADMDEDDYGALVRTGFKQCPFYQNGDEYLVVRHQM